MKRKKLKAQKKGTAQPQSEADKKPVPAYSKQRQEAKLYHILSVSLILIISIAIYSNTLKNGFVYDDESTIVNNTLIKDFSNISKLFTKEYFISSAEASYRPVVTFTYFLDYAIYGLNPYGFHLTNLILHAINGVLLYIFLTSLITHNSSLITLISLLFVTHPVLTEAVNAISFREDLLCFLFFISALILYLYPTPPPLTKRRSLLYALSCLFYLLALLSKEMAITFPLIIILYEWIYGGKKEHEFHEYTNGTNMKVINNKFIRIIRPFGSFVFKFLFNPYTLCYVAVTCFYFYLRFYLFHNPVEENIEAWSLYERLMTIPYLILKYLFLLIAPVSLSADYVITPIQSLISLKFIIPFIVILLLIIVSVSVSSVSVSSGQRNKEKVFGILFLLLTLLPVYNIIPIANPLAERYLYLPSVGFVIIVGVVIHTFINIGAPKIYKPRGLYILVVSILILSIYSFAVIQRNKVWADQYSLWSDTVIKMPESFKGHNGLGIVYNKQGRLDEAIKEYLTAIRFKPAYADAHYNLGNVYEKQGQLDEAIKEYKLALSLKPDYADAHNNLGNAYNEQSRMGEAIKEYKLALSLKPAYADAHYNLGNVYEKQGQLDEAIKEYKLALSLKPDFAFAHNNLGLAYEKQGQLDEAIKKYLEAIRFKPDFAITYRNLGRTYIKQNKLGEAIDKFLIALKLNPDDAVAHYNLAGVYSMKGLNEKAIGELEIALRLKPDYIPARQTLESIRKSESQSKKP